MSISKPLSQEIADEVRLWWSAKKPTVAKTTRDKLTKAAAVGLGLGMAAHVAARKIEDWGNR